LVRRFEYYSLIILDATRNVIWDAFLSLIFLGNDAFVAKFDNLIGIGRGIDEVYRIVNGEDVVARLPRSVNALGLAKVGYEHCGPTVLLSGSEDKKQPQMWIEGVNNGNCPVRDGNALTGPLAQGSLIGDIVSAIQTDADTKSQDNLSTVYDRLKNFTAADIPSIVGVDKQFVKRETKIIDSIFKGEALGDHMEDKYYSTFQVAVGIDVP